MISMTLMLPRYDIVVDATDNAPSRYLISDCCVVLGKVSCLYSPFLITRREYFVQ